MRVRAIWSNFLRSQRAYSRACSLAAKGDHEKAVAIFDEVIAAKTGDWGACIQRALSLSETGEYAMAVESAKKAASLAQWNAVPYLFLGRIHYDHGHYDRALNALERCLELDASNGLAAAYKGLVFLAMTRMDRARDTLAAANIRSMNSSFQGRLIALCEARLAKHTGALSLEECAVVKRLWDRVWVLHGFGTPAMRHARAFLKAAARGHRRRCWWGGDLDHAFGRPAGWQTNLLQA